MANKSEDFNKADTIKINEYINNASKYINIKPDSAKFFIDSLMDLSVKSNNYYGLFKSYNNNGIYYWMYSQYDSALINYKKALEYSALTTEKRNKALVLGNIGLLYSNLFITDSANKYLKESIDYCQKYKINDILTKSRYDLGILYLNQGSYVKALMYFKPVEDSLKLNPNPKL
ncbi:MAG: hypothetical protein C0595_02785, partial [Marinilabiliales bacterium]